MLKGGHMLQLYVCDLSAHLHPISPYNPLPHDSMTSVTTGFSQSAFPSFPRVPIYRPAHKGRDERITLSKLPSCTIASYPPNHLSYTLTSVCIEEA